MLLTFLSVHSHWSQLVTARENTCHHPVVGATRSSVSKPVRSRKKLFALVFNAEMWVSLDKNAVIVIPTLQLPLFTSSQYLAFFTTKP